jgi:hypothetical protein
MGAVLVSHLLSSRAGRATDLGARHVLLALDDEDDELEILRLGARQRGRLGRSL